MRILFGKRKVYLTDNQKYNLVTMTYLVVDSFLFQGKVPMLSLEALHHLHIFIFVLALVHVIFCATTMVLGGAKVSYVENLASDAYIS